ncbi:MAG: class I SAM-dependent methyltransferase [Chloroflexi bacterium]|nr:class I SAM-dependent methyltransferase [Chloroflexota bacterium]
MEILRGKHASMMDAPALAQRLAGYQSIHLDLGTGDGRYAAHIARTHPAAFAIGLDACRENLAQGSRRAPPNTLFVIANASALPVELDGMAASISINFPWGSLVEALLEGQPSLLRGLTRVAASRAALDVRLNGEHSPKLAGRWTLARAVCATSWPPADSPCRRRLPSPPLT